MKALRLISVIAIVVGFLSLTAFGQEAANAEPEPQKTLTISGNVGIAGVVVRGIPGTNTVSDALGRYLVEVPKGWTGTVMPFKEGYEFSPERRQYDNINSDYDNQDFVRDPKSYVIEGYIKPKLPGVVLQGLPGLPVTSESGFYSGNVEQGWSGTVTPVKEGYRFNPPSRTYETVTASMENQDYGYIATALEDVYGMYQPAVEASPAFTDLMAGSALNSGARLDVLVIPIEDVSPGAFSEIQEDMRVMNHILCSTIEENRSNLVGGVFTDYGTFFGRNGAAFDGLYIQGYGAVFFIESDMPLTVFRAALNTPESETSEQDDNVDPVWQQARYQVLSPNRRRPQVNRVQAEPDEILKKLIMTLKHATNLHIASDERIIVNVLSQRTAGRGEMIRFGDMAFEEGRRGDGLYGRGSAESDPRGGAGRTSRGGKNGRVIRTRIDRPVSMLTLQVDKRNVDAFARGEVDYDTFRKSVDVFKY